jgi:uncharacterized protein YeaO (DUF488 family)
VSPEIRCKRIYDGVDPGDGTRILFERLWPHGIRKADTSIGHWLEEIASSAELRRWYRHVPARWDPRWDGRYPIFTAHLATQGGDPAGVCPA